MIRRIVLFVSFLLMIFTVIRIFAPELSDRIVTRIQNFSFSDLFSGPVGFSLPELRTASVTNDNTVNNIVSSGTVSSGTTTSGDIFDELENLDTSFGTGREGGATKSGSLASGTVTPIPVTGTTDVRLTQEEYALLSLYKQKYTKLTTEYTTLQKQLDTLQAQYRAITSGGIKNTGSIQPSPLPSPPKTTLPKNTNNQVSPPLSPQSSSSDADELDYLFGNVIP